MSSGPDHTAMPNSSPTNIRPRKSWTIVKQDHTAPLKQKLLTYDANDSIDPVVIAQEMKRYAAYQGLFENHSAVKTESVDDVKQDLDPVLALNTDEDEPMEAMGLFDYTLEDPLSVDAVVPVDAAGPRRKRPRQSSDSQTLTPTAVVHPRQLAAEDCEFKPWTGKTELPSEDHTVGQLAEDCDFKPWTIKTELPSEDHTVGQLAEDCDFKPWTGKTEPPSENSVAGQLVEDRDFGPQTVKSEPPSEDYVGGQLVIDCDFEPSKTEPPSEDTDSEPQTVKSEPPSSEDLVVEQLPEDGKTNKPGPLPKIQRRGCRECEITFRDAAELLVHMRCVHSTYACSQCAKPFKSCLAAVWHETRSHPLSCVVCRATSFNTCHDLVAHRYVCQPSGFHCDLCGREETDRARLADHLRVVHSRYRCDVCGWLQSDQKSSERHQHAHARSRHNCPLCLRIVPNGRLKRHLLADHLRHRCDACGLRVGTPGELNAHVATHASQRRCDRWCRASFATRAELERHVAKVHRCGRCDAEFMSGGEVRRHEETHSPSGAEPRETNEARWPDEVVKAKRRNVLSRRRLCRLCPDVFLTPEERPQHDRMKHGVAVVSGDVRPSFDIAYECRHCGLRLGSVDAFMDHEKSHEYRCESCGVLFPAADSLAEHRKETHPREVCDLKDREKSPGYRCRYCGVLFDEPEVLAKHQREMHGTKYQCNACTFHLGSGDELFVHAEQHPVKYQCKDCKRLLDSLEELIVHENEHR